MITVLEMVHEIIKAFVLVPIIIIYKSNIIRRVENISFSENTMIINQILFEGYKI